MTCQSCKWLDVPPNKAGKIVAYAAKSYWCKAPLPDFPALPDSVTQAYGFTLPTHRRFMGTEDGENCPSYEPRKP